MSDTTMASQQTMATESGSQLSRSLTLWPIVFFGLTYITPFIVLTTFGVFSAASNGTLATAYAITTIAVLFTAASYGKMVRLYPHAGSAYTYVQKGIEPRLGFMVGWATLLDYFFLPMVVWLIGVAFLTDQFPSVPGWVFLSAFIILTTALNIVGIKIANRTSLLLVAFEVLVLAFFIAFSLVHVVGAPELGITLNPFWNSSSTVTAVAAGAALTGYSFIGFDAVSTFSEEATNPRETMPKAIVLSALIAGLIFVLVAYVVQLVHPSAMFEDPESAPLQIATTIAGDVFASVFLATVVIAQFAAGIPIQAAGSRLMYGMGRDGGLPKRFFGYVSPRFRTPVFNILLTGLVGFLALSQTVASATSLINFGAFCAFSFVNITVIVVYFRGRQSGDGKHRNPITWVVFPLIGLAFIVWLLTSLDTTAIVLGVIWVAIGFCWLLVITRGFRRPPPEMDLREDAEV